MILKLIVLMSTFLFSQDPCTCENDFNPVCGFDGFTYPNECMALCFGVSVDYQGSCTNQINCLAFDENNKLWVGTSSGLFSYDGRNFNLELDSSSVEPSFINVTKLLFNGDSL